LKAAVNSRGEFVFCLHSQRSQKSDWKQRDDEIDNKGLKENVGYGEIRV